MARVGMICLDTNYLIGGVTSGRPESAHLQYWLDRGELFCTSAPAWYEFLCGPVTPRQKEAMESVVEGRVMVFDGNTADFAASLFNSIGRPRRNRIDVMIAAIAIWNQTPLATMNSSDFTVLENHGLELVPPPT